MQRWPAVPTAPNTAPISDISRSAFSVMMMALLPPSSSRLLPRRAPTAALTALPIRVDPVADTSGTRVSLLISSPMLRSPITRQLTPSLILFRLKTSCAICWHAMAVKGVFSDGFQTHTSPQTQASMAFQLQTATGKLKADITPTIPSEWYCSYMRCSGRSLCMVRPYNCRLSPTAKSHISIISCTSP